MLKLILAAFLTARLYRFQPLQLANNDYVDYITNLTPLLFLIPTMTRHNEICKDDEDCPMIMRCCEVGTNKYCCTPNNFVKMSYAFHNQDINSTYNDAALIPLEDLPKNDFYKNFTNNNYSKKYGGIIYPPE